VVPQAAGPCGPLGLRRHLQRCKCSPLGVSHPIPWLPAHGEACDSLGDIGGGYWPAPLGKGGFSHKLSQRTGWAARAIHREHACRCGISFVFPPLQWLRTVSAKYQAAGRSSSLSARRAPAPRAPDISLGAVSRAGLPLDSGPGWCGARNRRHRPVSCRAHARPRFACRQQAAEATSQLRDAIRIGFECGQAAGRGCPAQAKADMEPIRDSASLGLAHQARPCPLQRSAVTSADPDAPRQRARA